MAGVTTTACGVCRERESKYKCPICELRYCSIDCYKQHKTSHGEQEATIIQRQQQAQRDRPGTKQRVPKVDFTDFEADADFRRLLTRYPLLKMQLSVAYGLTLEPGPDDKYGWNRGPLLPSPFSVAPQAKSFGARGRGRGGRGGRGDRGGRGGRGGGRGSHAGPELPEERQHGQWTQDKGDKEALLAVKKMKSDVPGLGGEDERVEGMREFIELCQIKFGMGRQRVEEQIKPL